MEILLKDVLEFDKLRKEYPDRRIKLRFNKYKEYEDITYNFVEWYKEDKESKKFKDSLLTVWSSKKKRIQDNDIIFQFIEISYHKWLLVYVGSATGEEGIFGRWRTYLSKGYDEEEEKSKDYPNKGLKEIVKNNGLDYIKNNFQYSILEIFTKNKLGATKALEREKYWKNLLDSHTPHGYNYN